VIAAGIVLYLIALALSGSGMAAANATRSQNNPIEGPYISAPVTPGLSPAVRDLPVEMDAPGAPYEIPSRRNPHADEPDQGQRGTWDRENVPHDPLPRPADPKAAPNALLNFDFEGVGNPVGCGTCSPPDPNGDAGPNHYIQMVNATKVAIYDKLGTLVAGPFNLGTLWTTSPCNGNLGDPVVLYDPLADRWLLSQFATSNRMCVAISQTADPTGSYHTYSFNVLDFPDYFKFGVWPDGYYMSANENTYTAYAFDRANMLNGAPATFVKFTGGENFYLPSDVDGPTPPPVGAPNHFYTFLDNTYHGGGPDRLEVWDLHVDWVTPANSTFTLVSTLPVASFTYTPCGFFNFNCVRQLGTTQRFDALGEWPLFRFPYRNFGSREVLVGTYVIGGGLGEVGAALRWFELRNTGGGWTLFQEGTIDPGDGHDRTNSSIAMDQDGNMAIGYTVSSSTINPEIRYAVRLASDPPGTFGPEVTIIDPAGSQTGSNRWGDYSAMSVDPADDCTFWYTNEYYPANSANQWHTRVGVFTIPGCGGPTPTPSLTVTPGGPTFTPTPTRTPSPTRTNTPTPLPRCGAPDPFGYHCDDTVTRPYIDATTNTGINGDDQVVSIPIGFNFSFYGSSYSQVAVSSNGNLQFTTSDTEYSNTCPLPEPLLGVAIFPLWDDLYPPAGGAIEYSLTGSAPNRILTIEWDDIQHFPGSASGVTFEVQLEETTNEFYLLYQDTDFGDPTYDDGASASVGIQNGPGGYALQYSCDEPVLSAGRNIRFWRGGTSTPTPTRTNTPPPSATSTPTATGTPIPPTYYLYLPLITKQP
jgi:hypothetical protein